MSPAGLLNDSTISWIDRLLKVHYVILRDIECRTTSCPHGRTMITQRISGVRHGMLLNKKEANNNIIINRKLNNHN